MKQKLYWRKNAILYLMMVPALIYMLIFKLFPLYGLTIAFKDYNIFGGADAMDAIRQSPWVGFENFIDIFSKPDFIHVFSNTLILSLLKLVFLFPLPIILALLLNELQSKWFKGTVQTVLYLPHFLSWVVVAGLALNILGSTGIVNSTLEQIMGVKLNFLMSPSMFRGVLIGTDAWKETGFAAVIYIAAISSIGTEQYEAAKVDGASRIQKIIYITLPSIFPTIVLMLILRVGGLLDDNFQQILVMYNPSVYETADVIQTYIYRMGMGQMNFTVGVTVGMFNSVVSFILITSANFISKKLLKQSIW